MENSLSQKWQNVSRFQERKMISAQKQVSNNIGVIHGMWLTQAMEA